LDLDISIDALSRKGGFLSFELGRLFACLKCLLELIIFTVTTRASRCAPASPVGILIVRGILATWSALNHAVAHIRAAAAFLAETGLILEEICDVLCLLADVGALVLAVLVDVLELLERLDKIDVVTEVDDDVLGASMETVVEQRERLQESWIRAPRSCGRA
jgi:hypothetical protein